MRFAMKSILALCACVMLSGCGCWPPKWHCDCDERNYIQYESPTPPMTDNVIPPTPQVPGKIAPWQKSEVTIADPDSK